MVPYETTISVPQQINPEILETIEQVADQLTDGVVTVIGSSGFLGVLLGVSLKAIWGLVSVLQFIVYFELWNMSMPENLMITLREIKYIALCEFLDVSWIKDPLFEALHDMSNKKDETLS